MVRNLPKKGKEIHTRPSGVSKGKSEHPSRSFFRLDLQEADTYDETTSHPPAPTFTLYISRPISRARQLDETAFLAFPFAVLPFHPPCFPTQTLTSSARRYPFPHDALSTGSVYGFDHRRRPRAELFRTFPKDRRARGERRACRRPRLASGWRKFKQG
jgi:hypothetical protein